MCLTPISSVPFHSCHPCNSINHLLFVFVSVRRMNHPGIDCAKNDMILTWWVGSDTDSTLPHTNTHIHTHTHTVHWYSPVVGLLRPFMEWLSWEENASDVPVPRVEVPHPDQPLSGTPMSDQDLPHHLLELQLVLLRAGVLAFSVCGFRSSFLGLIFFSPHEGARKKRWWRGGRG